MKKRLALFTCLAITVLSRAQNVGINSTGATPNASAGLDIDFSNRGLLIPRVALTATNATGPITAPATSLIVYNTATAGVGTTAVSPGYYYWNGTVWSRVSVDGADWRTTGNAGTVASTNFIGTTDAVDFVGRTNNIERFRVMSNGAFNIWSGTNYAAPIGFMAGGSLTIGNIGANFGGGTGWSANTAGLLFEAMDNTEIAIHDSGTRLASLAYYEGGVNRITMGRDMGWGTISTISMFGNVGIGTLTPAHKLDVVGVGNANIDVRTNGRYWSNSPSGGLWLSDAMDAFVGNNGLYAGFWTNGVGFNALSITKSNGFTGIGLQNAVSRLQLSNNVATGALDNFSEYQLMLYQSVVAPVNSFGLGIRGGTLVYNSGNFHQFDVVGTTMATVSNIGVGVGAGVTAPGVRLAVGGNGFNVYGTDQWVENNVHVQGNETMTQGGGRGRLRIGNAWGYAALYSETTSNGVNNDLLLGASSGWVRIGPGGPGQSLYIPSGTLQMGIDNALKPGSSTWTIISDERLKSISGKYERGLAEVVKLNPIVYTYQNAEGKIFDKEVEGKTQIGFTAQEVQRIFPEAVGVGEDGYLNLNIHAILIAYTNAIKELDATNKQHEQELKAMNQRLERLERLLEEKK